MGNLFVIDAVIGGLAVETSVVTSVDGTLGLVGALGYGGSRDGSLELVPWSQQLLGSNNIDADVISLGTSPHLPASSPPRHGGLPFSMTQSLGPEQLAQQLALVHPEPDARPSSDRMAMSYDDRGEWPPTGDRPREAWPRVGESLQEAWQPIGDRQCAVQPIGDRQCTGQPIGDRQCTVQPVGDRQCTVQPIGDRQCAVDRSREPWPPIEDRSRDGWQSLNHPREVWQPMGERPQEGYQPDRSSEYGLTNGLSDEQTRPTCLFETHASYNQLDDDAVQLCGSSTFVPAPESVMSPHQQVHLAGARGAAGAGHQHLRTTASHRPHSHVPSHYQQPQTHHNQQPQTHHQQQPQTHHQQPMTHHQQPPQTHHQQPPQTHHQQPMTHHQQPPQTHHQQPQTHHQHSGISAHQASHQAAEHRQQELGTGATRGARSSALQRPGNRAGGQRPQPTPAVASPKLSNTRARTAGAKGVVLGSDSSRPSSARPALSPKPAPRTSSRGRATTNVSSSSHRRISPDDCSDSDNTDSEISVSKLQTIKSIAAERRMTERGRDPTPPRSHRHYGAPTSKGRLVGRIRAFQKGSKYASGKCSDTQPTSLDSSNCTAA
ncbi:hypothetical protein FHG87_016340 [Trinorchestia longiramus]|nr:hypothetical protein FHG87_016340 [Trinorchestia longiramus]